MKREKNQPVTVLRQYDDRWRYVEITKELASNFIRVA
jgi:hypothetical protein